MREKVVKGYSTNAIGYHSWNEIYNEMANEWDNIDLTYDIQAKALGMMPSMKKVRFHIQKKRNISKKRLKEIF
ncbi:hypothetical protein [Cellulosilyticum ruminicola]|uniref:hypothetical protein n=1 Tax=Cellulosilyticum ruminicola TaxID=425254 RepID=UPI0006D18F0A|nr:hypothetical protein [Cellulosilyticum ruminicola]